MGSLLVGCLGAESPEHLIWGGNRDQTGVQCSLACGQEVLAVLGGQKESPRCYGGC